MVDSVQLAEGGNMKICDSPSVAVGRAEHYEVILLKKSKQLDNWDCLGFLWIFYHCMLFFSHTTNTFICKLNFAFDVHFKAHIGLVKPGVH